MSGVLRGESFSQENMTQVAVTVGTQDLRSVTVSVGFSFDSSLDLIVKAGPSTVAVKFILRLVEWGIALFANIDSLLIMIHVLTSPGSLGPFLKDYILLDCGEFVIVFGIHNGTLDWFFSGMGFLAIHSSSGAQNADNQEGFHNLFHQ